jgi:hypothetical protein
MREEQGVPLPAVGSGYPLQVLARLRLPPGFPLLSLTHTAELDPAGDIDCIANVFLRKESLAVKIINVISGTNTVNKP